MAALDPVDYLRSIQPFQSLPAERFQEAARSLEVGFFPAGTWLVRVGAEPLQHLYVIRKGAVRIERDGQTLQILEEGEVFGHSSLVSGKASLDVAVEEDLLAYRIPGEVVLRLQGDAAFAAHFASGLADRLKASLSQAPVTTFRPDLSMRVEQIVKRAPVWAAVGATVGDAARQMVEAGVGSVLVPGEPPGIVTDRDFRSRVLAAGLGPEVPLTQICSRPLRTVDAGAPIHDAWATLLESGAHHMPVVRDGQIVGMLTSSDLLRATAQGPVAVLRSVQRLPSRESLPGYAGRVTEMVAACLNGNLGPKVIAGLVARLNDALVGRLLQWAEAELGPPPAPYAWVALGSEGRREQTLITDQDNALVFADEGEARRDWYAALAEQVNRDLEAAGFPPCGGGYMARKWSGTLGEWRRRFAGWMESPEPQQLLAASIFFDFRRVGGTLELEPLEAQVEQAARHPVFLRLLAREALEFHPPPALLLRLRGDSSTVDLKLQGLSAVVFLARRYALAAGTRARNTLERLEAAERAGLLDKELHEGVAEAYGFLAGLRLRLQLKQLAEGRPASNKVALDALTALERSRLKEAFRAIRGWQEKAAYAFRADA